MKNGKKHQAEWKPSGYTDKRFGASFFTYDLPKVGAPHVNSKQGNEEESFFRS